MQKIRFILYTLISCLLLEVSFNMLSTEAVAQNRVQRSALTIIDNGVLYYVHTAKRREKIEDIANVYNVQVRVIKEANLGVRDILKRGQTVMIPTTQITDNELQDVEKEAEEVIPSGPTADSLLENEALIDDLYGESDYDSMIVEATSRVEFGETAKVDNFEPLTVAMLLPFGDVARGSDKSFAQFYRGALIAFEELKRTTGRDFRLELFSTSNSVEMTYNLVRSGALSDANLIIGPVYSEEFEVVASYAALKRIPVVSPLGSTGKASNPFVIEVAPQAQSKWDGVRPILGDVNANVIVIEHTSYTDELTMAELQGVIPMTAKRVSYTDKNTPIEALSDVLSSDTKNIIIVPTSNEIASEEILSRYSSINALNRYDISVVGTPRWARYNRVNLDLFYKLNVIYPTSYYFDRLDFEVRDFFNEYLQKYNELPSMYVYRGYDVALIIGGALARDGERMLYSLLNGTVTALQTPYTFTQSVNAMDGSDKIVNTAWATVMHKRDYSTEIR